MRDKMIWWNVEITATHPKTRRKFFYSGCQTVRTVNWAVALMRLRGFGKIYIKWSRAKGPDDE